MMDGARTDVVIDVVLIVCSAVCSFSLSEVNLVGWSFSSRFFRKATAEANYVRSRLNTWLSPRNDLSFARDVRSWRSQMISVVCSATTHCLGRITCPRYSTILSKKKNFLSLRQAHPSLKCVSTL